MLRDISDEGIAAVKSGDVSLVSKYIHPCSVLIVDMDPAPDRGETQIPYEDYIPTVKMALEAMNDPVLDVEILSIDIDRANNQGTIVEKTTAIMTMFGTTVKDVSQTLSVYGYIDGEVKVLKTVNTIISSEILK